MRKKLEEYFSEKTTPFDAIYSGETSPLMKFLNRRFRWDMIERARVSFRRLSKEGLESILDIGCGTGRLALELGRAGKKVLGVDFSSKMIDMAEDLKEKEGVSNVEFLCIDILDYNSRNKYDASVALGFFDYVKEPCKFLDKIASLTKYRFIATFPRKGTLRAFLRKIRLFFLGCKVYFYTPHQIKDLLREAGFRIIDFRIIGQLYFIEAEKL